MVAGNALGVLRCGALLAAVLALAGCPIPLPAGYQASSRENLPAEPLDWVTVGVTTREDVLLKLGEADGEAPDGSWLAYGSAYAKGGVLFVLFAGSSAAGAGGETVRYHRLIISFDDTRHRLGHGPRLPGLLGVHRRRRLVWCAESAVPEDRLPRVNSLSRTARRRKLAPCSPRCRNPGAGRVRVTLSEVLTRPISPCGPMPEHDAMESRKGFGGEGENRTPDLGVMNPSL